MTAEFHNAWWPILAALLVLIIIGFAFMVMLQVMKPEDAVKRIVGLLALVTLIDWLIEILEALWRSMSYWQHAAIVLIGLLFAIGTLRKPQSGGAHRK